MFHLVPPRVEYSLTAYGRTLGPILEALRAWGEQHLQRAAGSEGTLAGAARPFPPDSRRPETRALDGNGTQAAPSGRLSAPEAPPDARELLDFRIR